MRRGYMRVSTKEQQFNRQLNRLKEVGVEKYYYEKASGRTLQRKEYQRLMDELQPGDVVIITDMTRISRNTRDLLGIIESIRTKEAAIKSLDDPWLDTTDANPFQDFLITVMAGLAELERRLTVQRINEGLDAARAAGRIGGRPSITTDQINLAFELYRSGQSIREICAAAQISRSTFYNYKRSHTMKKGKTPEEKKAEMAELIDKLEQGVKEVFSSGRYENYLKVMSQFHQYSVNNTVLIWRQRPDATKVAGYTTWQKLKRQVRKGEKGIRIMAPSPYRVQMEVEQLDPVTQKPLTDNNGNVKTQIKETTIPAYKPVSVFDISQTDGEPLPEITHLLTGDITHYDEVMAALQTISPYPINFEHIPGSTNGYCDYMLERIVVDAENPPAQQIITAIHEISHAVMHASAFAENRTLSSLDKQTREVEAESVAYIVATHYGLDTSEYSFGYVASWSRGKELKELQASLNNIQEHAQQMIEQLDELFQDLQLEQTIQPEEKPSLAQEIQKIKAEQQTEKPTKNQNEPPPKKQKKSGMER